LKSIPLGTLDTEQERNISTRMNWKRLWKWRAQFCWLAVVQLNRSKSRITFQKVKQNLLELVLNISWVTGKWILLSKFLRFCSPFLVGNLWDVTDKDMDTMTEFILEAATTPNSVSDFLELLQQARNQSKMKYLNGSALVCYGVPLGFVYN